MKFVIGILILQLSGVMAWADAIPGEIKGETYLVHCSQVMELFNKRDASDTIEKRFLEAAKTPGQMAQLLRDYALILNKEFAEAVLYEARPPKNETNRIAMLDQMIKISRLPDEEFNAFVWKVVNRIVDLKSQGQKEAQSQIAFTQAKNFIEALKDSPNRPVAEKIFSIIIRHSLLERTERLVNQGWYDADYVGKVALGVGFVVGMISGYLVTRGYGFSPFTFMFAGALTGFVGTWPIFLGANIKGLFRAFRAGNTSTVELKFINTLNEEEKWSTDQAFQILEGIEKKPKNAVKPIKSEMLSIKDGCEGDACRLTPVQLAYLGHIDFLELEALQKSVNEALKSVNSDQEIGKLDASARELRDNPGNYFAQMQLKLDLGAFTQKMKSLLEAQQTAVDALTKYAQDVSTVHMKSLAQKPYEVQPKNQDEILKNGMVLIKIENDLKNLESIKLNSGAMSEKVARSKKIVNTLSEMLGALPQNKEGWKEAAEEVIARLDELR